MSRSSLLYRQYIKYFYGVFVINFTSSSMQYNDRSTISICMQGSPASGDKTWDAVQLQSKIHAVRARLQQSCLWINNRLSV